jgi:hypothetical protein
MNRQTLINNTIDKLKKLSDSQLQYVNDYTEHLLGKIDDEITLEGIQKIASESKTFEFLNEEEELYTVEDLKEKYR